MKKRKKLQIAKACHNAHNVLCEMNGMHVIPWEEKSESHKKTVLNSIEKILTGGIQSPEEAHENFVVRKERDGWSYAPEYSETKMTNPRLCDWDELEDIERKKEELFFSIVSSFKK